MKLQGKIDSKSGKKNIFGYLLDENNLSIIKEAKVLIDGEEFYTQSGLFKQFVQNKYANGYHGFKIEIPKKFKDSPKKTHIVELRDKETNTLVDKKELVFFSTSTQSSSLLVPQKKLPKPKVSVIIPVYNTGFILNTTLSSVVNQTLKEIEIIVVNDKSTDNSEEIITKFIQQDRRIKYISHEHNMSSSQARKNGVAVAEGDYIMFVDGDDELAPNCIEKAYTTIKEKNVDIVNFGTKVINCGNMAQSRIDMNQRMLEPFNGLLKGNIQKACFIDKKFAFNVWNKIYNAEVCKKGFNCVENGCFPKAQDLYAFFYISKFANSYYGFSDQLYKYNFGFGVTGGDSIDLEKFKKLISESLILQALQRDKKNASTETDRIIIKNIKFNLINECYSKFENQLDFKDKNVGFNLLVNAFGCENLVAYLAQKYWHQRVSIGEKLSDFSYFKESAKDVRTIALYYDTLSNGGAQRVTVQIANLLSKKYKVIILSDNKTKDDKNEYNIDRNIVHDYLPDVESSRVEKYHYRAEKWKALLDKYHIDLVITGLWLNPVTFWDILTLKLNNTKVIVHAHSTCILPYKIEDQTSLDLTYRYAMSDGVVALSKCDQFFISSFNKNCLQICNPSINYSSEKEYQLSAKKGFNIVWVGRISNEKRPLDAVMMMEKLVMRLPESHLYIVGGGSENIIQKMKERIEQKSLGKHVSLEGFTLDVDRYYSKADVFICTSEYEGWSLTIGEAMTYHLPVISYDMPYLEFFIDGRGIISVPQGNYSIMALEVEKLLRDRNRLNTIGEEAYQNICNKNESSIFGKWEKLISTIANGKTEVFDNYSTQDINKFKSIIFHYITEFQNKAKNALLTEKLRLKKILDNQNS